VAGERKLYPGQYLAHWRLIYLGREPKSGEYKWQARCLGCEQKSWLVLRLPDNIPRCPFCKRSASGVKVGEYLSDSGQWRNAA
jgi:hypothetical protein